MSDAKKKVLIIKIAQGDRLACPPSVSHGPKGPRPFKTQKDQKGPIQSEKNVILLLSHKNMIITNCNGLTFNPSHDHCIVYSLAIFSDNNCLT